MNFFLAPTAYYKDNIYQIYLFCKGRDRKALFCLNRAWRQFQEVHEKNYLELEGFQALANKNIRAMKSFLSIYINFDNTTIPYEFRFCMTINTIKEQFNTLLLKLNKENVHNVHSDKLLIVNSVPFFPKVVFSSEVRQKQLEKIPFNLVASFQKCMRSSSPDNQKQAVQNLAVSLRQAGNENHLLILADLAQDKGLEGVVIQECVKLFIANQKFEQAWALADKLSKEEEQAHLFALIAEAQIPPEPVQVGSDIPKLQRADEKYGSYIKSPAAELVKTCQQLNREGRYEESLQNVSKMWDSLAKANLLGDIAVGLNDKGEIQRAHEVIAMISDPSLRFSIYLDVYQTTSIDKDKFNILKETAKQIDSEDERLDAFSDLLKIARIRDNNSWYKEIYPLYQELDAQLGSLYGSADESDGEENMQESIDKAMQMDEGAKRDQAFEKICTALIAQGKYKDAFEYSDNIEDPSLQSFMRLKICQALLPLNKLSLLQQVANTIQELDVKEQAYELLVFQAFSSSMASHTTPPTSFDLLASQASSSSMNSHTITPTPTSLVNPSYMVDQDNSLWMPTSVTQTVIRRTNDPKTTWKQNVEKAEQIADSDVRDRAFADLAQEAKRNDWWEEVYFVVEKIQNPLIATTCF